NISSVTAEKVKELMLTGVEEALGLPTSSLQTPIYSRMQLCQGCAEYTLVWRYYDYHSGRSPESRGSGGSAPGSRVQGAAAPGRVQGAEPLAGTRPDIAFVVGKLSRYTSNPSALHWQALGRVFQYLKGTMDYGLTYSGYPSVIEGYSDASWINNMEDHSSTSGWVFLLGGAGNEAEWLRNLIYEIPLWPKSISTISIRCDSAATLAKAYSQVYNGKSRHLGVRHCNTPIFTI
ncbi:hypothetical protein Tco_1086363, partial [Tanacetum coccineum]